MSCSWLAVLDFLYKKKFVHENDENVEIETDFDKVQDSSKSDYEEDICFQVECGVTVVNKDIEADLLPNVSPVIDKVRRTDCSHV